jgi:hypothetical protein
MTTPLEAAWVAIHDATPPGWFVGRPHYDEYRNQWTQFAFDTNDRGKPGKPRTREWLAVGTSELHVLQEMARCLEVIGRGEWPS